MKRLALLALLIAGCDGALDPSPTTDGLLGTWQAPDATLALTPLDYRRPSYVYIAPNGAAVLGHYTVAGDTLSLEAIGDAKFAVEGNAMTVSLPDWTKTFIRVATYR